MNQMSKSNSISPNPLNLQANFGVGVLGQQKSSSIMIEQNFRSNSFTTQNSLSKGQLIKRRSQKTKKKPQIRMSGNQVAFADTIKHKSERKLQINYGPISKINETEPEQAKAVGHQKVLPSGKVLRVSVNAKNVIFDPTSLQSSANRENTLGTFERPSFRGTTEQQFSDNKELRKDEQQQILSSVQTPQIQTLNSVDKQKRETPTLSEHTSTMMHRNKIAPPIQIGNLGSQSPGKKISFQYQTSVESLQEIQFDRAISLHQQLADQVQNSRQKSFKKADTENIIKQKVINDSLIDKLRDQVTQGQDNVSEKCEQLAVKTGFEQRLQFHELEEIKADRDLANSKVINQTQEETPKYIITTEQSDSLSQPPAMPQLPMTMAKGTSLQPRDVKKLFSGQSKKELDHLLVNRQNSAKDLYSNQIEPHFSNVTKKDLMMDDQKLIGMLDEFKQRKSSERKEHKGKDAHILDSYIQVLTYLDQTSRFQEIFEVENLKPMLIRPTCQQQEYAEVEFFQLFELHKETDEAIIFLYGVYMYDLKDYQFAMKAFTKLLDMGKCKQTGDQLSVLEYEARFNIAVCLFKMADSNKAHKIFKDLMTEQRKIAEKKIRDDKNKGKSVAAEAHAKKDSVFKIADYVLRFTGRDRRLYYNKALCELYMGQFELTKKTCELFLRPVKRVVDKLLDLKEQKQQADKKKLDLGLKPVRRKSHSGDLSKIVEVVEEPLQAKKRANVDVKRSMTKKDLTSLKNDINQDSFSSEEKSSNKSMRSPTRIAQKNAIKKQKEKLTALTQFRKQNCGTLNFDLNKQNDEGNYQDHNKLFNRANTMGSQNSMFFQQQLGEENLHPKYSKQSSHLFIDDLYRIKAFSLLRFRSDLNQMQHENGGILRDDEQQDKQMCVIKAARCFQKALAGPEHQKLITRLNNRIRRQQRRKLQGLKPKMETKRRKAKNRAFLLALRRKIEGNLVEEWVDEQAQLNPEITNLTISAYIESDSEYSVNLSRERSQSRINEIEPSDMLGVPRQTTIKTKRKSGIDLKKGAEQLILKKTSTLNAGRSRMSGVMKGRAQTIMKKVSNNALYNEEAELPYGDLENLMHGIEQETQNALNRYNNNMKQANKDLEAAANSKRSSMKQKSFRAVTSKVPSHMVKSNTLRSQSKTPNLKTEDIDNSSCASRSRNNISKNSGKVNQSHQSRRSVMLRVNSRNSTNNNNNSLQTSKASPKSLHHTSDRPSSANQSRARRSVTGSNRNSSKRKMPALTTLPSAENYTFSMQNLLSPKDISTGRRPSIKEHTEENFTTLSSHKHKRVPLPLDVNIKNERSSVKSGIQTDIRIKEMDTDWHRMGQKISFRGDFTAEENNLDQQTKQSLPQPFPQPQKKISWLKSHSKFIREFAKEGKKIKREILMKKKFYTTMKGRNLIGQSQKNQLINTNIKEVVGPTQLTPQVSSQQTSSAMLSTMNRLSRGDGAFLSQRSSLFLPQLQQTALSQARFDRNIQKMTEGGHEFGRRYSNKTSLNRHSSMQQMIPIGLQIQQKMSQERLSIQPSTERKLLSNYATQQNIACSNFLQQQKNLSSTKKQLSVNNPFETAELNVGMRNNQLKWNIY